MDAIGKWLYGAEMEELRLRAEYAEELNESLQRAIDGLYEDKDALLSRNEKLDADVAALETRIAELEKDLALSRSKEDYYHNAYGSISRDYDTLEKDLASAQEGEKRIQKEYEALLQEHNDTKAAVALLRDLLYGAKSRIRELEGAEETCKNLYAQLQADRANLTKLRDLLSEKWPCDDTAPKVSWEEKGLADNS